jgi:hypothetical protein
MIQSEAGKTSIGDPRTADPALPTMPQHSGARPRAPVAHTATLSKADTPGSINRPDALRGPRKRAKVSLWKPDTNPAEFVRLTLRKDGETNGRDT